MYLCQIVLFQDVHKTIKSESWNGNDGVVWRARPCGHHGEKVLIALPGLFAQSNTSLYRRPLCIHIMLLSAHLGRRKAPVFEVVHNFSCLLFKFSVSILHNFHMTPHWSHITGYNQFYLVHTCTHKHACSGSLLRLSFSLAPRPV